MSACGKVSRTRFAAWAASRAGWADISLGITLHTTVTCWPFSAKSRAATHPSPPLFPLPHSTMKRGLSSGRALSMNWSFSLSNASSSIEIFFSAMRCALWARKRPARSMSSARGVPRFAISRSRCTTSATSRMGAFSPLAAYGERAFRYACTSCGSVVFALAGLVEGSVAAGMPRSFSQSRAYSCPAFAPVQNTAWMSAVSNMSFRLLGTTLRMEASLAPSISHEAATSHSAMPRRNSKSFLSSTVRGTGSSKTAASARQNLFWGCP